MLGEIGMITLIKDNIPTRIHQKLGAVMYFLLWKMWPRVSSGKPFAENPLLIISQAMDRFHSKSWYAFGYACTCTGSSIFMGQIDITVAEKNDMADTKLWAEKWCKRTY